MLRYTTNQRIKNIAEGIEAGMETPRIPDQAQQLIENTDYYTMGFDHADQNLLPIPVSISWKIIRNS